ncbi:hypothetical protein [Pseudodesulfovibrio piezophilus]|uniref:Uncharacterized protein n=1 Tax=Pseudodesulfovibrio piezophilus (strain DSM 21447 / JCM 15486 / C1TLV30) TaxID=1322246 RepID=M1WUQ8_PSEP2|nr:hypothetical protein [Pseudodesulfovibrio piezophilus]CCH47763.1 conserved protein of unknown function [Pseudodesulfovibrio piezophilus C1TLV30]
MIHGETVHSSLPMDLPWWMPDHFVFFGVLYVVLGVLGAGLAYTIIKSWCDSKKAQH